MAYCPNCSFPVEDNAERCTNCSAEFGPGSAWKPIQQPSDPVSIQEKPVRRYVLLFGGLYVGALLLSGLVFGMTGIKIPGELVLILGSLCVGYVYVKRTGRPFTKAERLRLTGGSTLIDALVSIAAVLVRASDVGVDLGATAIGILLIFTVFHGVILYFVYGFSKKFIVQRIEAA